MQLDDQHPIGVRSNESVFSSIRSNSNGDQTPESSFVDVLVQLSDMNQSFSFSFSQYLVEQENIENINDFFRVSLRQLIQFKQTDRKDEYDQKSWVLQHILSLKENSREVIKTSFRQAIHLINARLRMSELFSERKLFSRDNKSSIEHLYEAFLTKFIVDHNNGLLQENSNRQLSVERDISVFLRSRNDVPSNFDPTLITSYFMARAKYDKLAGLPANARINQIEIKNFDIVQYAIQKEIEGSEVSEEEQESLRLFLSKELHDERVTDIEGLEKKREAFEQVLLNFDHSLNSKDRVSLDLLEKDPNNPTILNLVLDAEDGALFQAIIQYANEDNRLDNLLDSTVSYAETNQQYRSLCWLAAQENSPLFASSNSAKKVHECFIIPEAWLNTADSILLRGIFNNYEENFDAYKNHCRTLHKTELQQYVQEVSQNFEKIVQGLLNQAIKLDDPVLILDIANLYLSWSDNPNDIKNRFFSAQKLEIIGPNTLAYLISNDGLCDHELLREELKQRYVKDPHKPQRLMNTQNPVRIALQKKYDFYQNVDRVANFYHAACRHVIEKGKSVSGQQKEFNIYKNKLQAIATEIASTLNSDATEKISAQAASVADKLIDNEYIGKNTGFFPPCCGFNKTQTEFNNRKKALSWEPKARELNQDTKKIGDYLTTDILYQIPLSQEEREACVKRAVEAHAVFKATLDYLSNRYGDNDAKLMLLEKHIQYYIVGRDDKGNEYLLNNFINQPELKTHRYSYSWRSLFRFQTTTEKKLREAIDMLRSLKG